LTADSPLIRKRWAFLYHITLARAAGECTGHQDAEVLAAPLAASRHKAAALMPMGKSFSDLLQILCFLITCISQQSQSWRSWEY